MPRQDGSQPFKSAVLASPFAPTALVASARNLSSITYAQKRKEIKPEVWQTECMDMYDKVDEYGYAMRWVGSIMSKAKLVILYDGKPIDDEISKAALNGLYGGPESHPEMLRYIGMHLSMGGEGYIVGAEDTDEVLAEWTVCPAAELKLIRTAGPGNSDVEWQIDDEIYTNPLVIRLWRPHPKRLKLADSASKSALITLNILHGLNLVTQAQITSRLVGNGVLAVPKDITFGSAQTVGAEDTGGKTSQQGINAFLQELLDTFTAALADPGTAASQVPILLGMEGEFIDKLKHITFWSEFDEKAPELRAEARRSLALGLDMPPEVLEGTADLNHWASWQVEEAAIKAHSEPLLEIITSSLSKGYLWPWLQSLVENPLDLVEAKRYTFGADTAEMRLRPNRSKEALELWDRGVLKAETLLRETGFSPEDAPTGEEYRHWLLGKVASGSTMPQQVAEALRQLGVDLGEIEATSSTEARPVRSLEEHPKREPPEMKDPLVAAGYLLVFRALERADNRLRTKLGGRKTPGITAGALYRTVEANEDELDNLLHGCWEACDLVAPWLGYAPEEMKARLDLYTRSLILDREEHTPERLAEYLRSP